MNIGAIRKSIVEMRRLIKKQQENAEIYRVLYMESGSESDMNKYLALRSGELRMERETNILEDSIKMETRCHICGNFFKQKIPESMYDPINQVCLTCDRARNG